MSFQSPVCCININAMPWHCIDVDMTLHKCHLPTGRNAAWIILYNYYTTSETFHLAAPLNFFHLRLTKLYGLLWLLSESLLIRSCNLNLSHLLYWLGLYDWSYLDRPLNLIKRENPFGSWVFVIWRFSSENSITFFGAKIHFKEISANVFMLCKQLNLKFYAISKFVF